MSEWVLAQHVIIQWAYHFLGGLLGSMSYGMVMGLRGKILFHSSCVGGIAWLAYKVLDQYIDGAIVPYFIATVIFALMSEIYARVFRTPTTVFLLVGMLPLVPGYGIYDTMLTLVKNDIPSFLSKGLETMEIAGALAMGILLVSTIFNLVTQYKHPLLNRRKLAEAKYLSQEHDVQEIRKNMHRRRVSLVDNEETKEKQVQQVKEKQAQQVSDDPKEKA